VNDLFEVDEELAGGHRRSCHVIWTSFVDGFFKSASVSFEGDEELKPCHTWLVVEGGPDGDETEKPVDVGESRRCLAESVRYRWQGFDG
jgi:hypothetical protein